MNETKNKEKDLNFFMDEKDENNKKILDKFCSYENEFYKIYNNTKKNNQKCEYFVLYKLIYSEKVEMKINSIIKDNYTEIKNNNNKDIFSNFKRCLLEVLSYVNIIDKESFYTFTHSEKEIIHNYLYYKKLFKKNRENEYLNIISDDIKKMMFIKKPLMKILILKMYCSRKLWII